MTTISQRIIQVVEAKCGSMSEFARRIGVTPAYISRLKNFPDSVPSDRTISDICREFNVNEAWLRTGEGEMFRPVDREAELFKWVGTVLADESDSFRRRFLNLLANLTPEEWQAMERYARALISPTDPTEP